MVAIRQEARADADAWWAWSPTQGWVMLDRSLFHNRVTHRPEAYEFVRCRDGATYRQGKVRWDYREAGKYLASLPAGEAMKAQRELAGLQEAFTAQRS